MLRPHGILIAALVLAQAAAPVYPQASGAASPSVRTVHVNDIDIACQAFGSGSPLLMIMGYGGSMDFWSPRLLKLLSLSHRVVVFDNRGMGRSTSSEREYTVPLFAEDTWGLIEALDVKPATVVAWSLGTEIALELAITHAASVRRLVLISGTTGGPQKIEPSPDVMRVFVDTSGSGLEWGLRLIWVLFPHAWLVTHPIISSYFPVNAAMNPPERTGRQFLALTRWEGCYAQLGLVKAPTLVMTGDEDVVVPPQNSVLLARGIPSARLVRIPGAGHGVIFQDPDRVVDEITAFLSATER